ncbi:hypothetical protein ABE501_20105 [Comamonas testosteroni]
MDIRFESPFEFKLEILETDDHVPSLRVSVRIIIEQFLHKFQYEGAFWIECAVWDGFAQALRNPSENNISLHDMSEHFMLSVKNTEQGILLEWKLDKPDIDGKRHINVNFSSIIDEEMVARIRQSFDDFPVWW